MTANATTYQGAPLPRACRLALRRRPSAADRLRATLARALVRAAERVAPRPSPMRSTDLWNG